MANDKLRLTFSKDELIEIYMGLGARRAMIRDGAAIRDQRPSEYSGQVNTLGALQDRIYDAVHTKEAPLLAQIETKE